MFHTTAPATFVDVPQSHEDPRTFMLRLTMIASLGGLLFGFDTGVIAGALVYLREDFNLTAVTEGLLVTSLLLPGATVGALLGGPVADRVGRKKSLVIAGVIFVASTVACETRTSVSAIIRSSPWMKRLIVVGIILAIAQQTTGINVVMYYAPTVLETSGFTRSASLLASVTVGIAMIVFTVLGMWILGLMGRRETMLLGFGGVAASHFGLLVTYLLPSSDFRSYLILVFMLLVTAFMVTFLGTTGFMVLNLLATVFAFRFIPETKGRTLEELEVELRHRYGGSTVEQPS